MFSKQNLLATLAGFLTMFLLGWLIWGFAMAEFYDGHTVNDIMKDNDNVNMLFIVLSNLIGAFALATIYGKWARGYHSFGSGFEFGIWIGIFAGISTNLMWYATAEFMSLTGHLVDGVVGTVYFALVGAVIALVYKATSTNEASS